MTLGDLHNATKILLAGGTHATTPVKLLHPNGRPVGRVESAHGAFVIYAPAVEVLRHAADIEPAIESTPKH